VAPDRRRYVLRYRGRGLSPAAADLARIHDLAGVTVVDESAPTMVLVEADDEGAAALSGSLPGWIVAPDQTFSVPDPPRHQID